MKPNFKKKTETEKTNHKSFSRGVINTLKAMDMNMNMKRKTKKKQNLMIN